MIASAAARASRRRRWLLTVLAAVAALALLPRWWCGRDGARLFRGDQDAQMELADHLSARLKANPRAIVYATGSTRFDGQSAIASYQMTVLGLGQIIQQHPELRERYLPSMQDAANKMIDPRTHPYAAQRYGQHGSVTMLPGQGHAYMGYINLALGMLRAVDPETPHGALHDRITAHLARELARSPHGMIETYPGESWPPDVAAVAGSIGLHGRVTGSDHRALLDEWAVRFAKCALHQPSGYLVQRLQTGGCQPADAPRGSGTAIGAYFIAFANRALSQKLYQALRETGAGTLLGFGAIREYAPGFSGPADVNAGPTPLGWSVGGTGFGLGAARAHDDETLFIQLYRSAHLFGIPYDDEHGRTFVAGGLLGNALLLAMLTAPKP